MREVSTRQRRTWRQQGWRMRSNRWGSPLRRSQSWWRKSEQIGDRKIQYLNLNPVISFWSIRIILPRSKYWISEYWALTGWLGAICWLARLWAFEGGLEPNMRNSCLEQALDHPQAPYSRRIQKYLNDCDEMLEIVNAALTHSSRSWSIMTSPHRYFHLLVLNWSYLKRAVYIFIQAISALLISLLDLLDIRN